jgi:AraC family transcriptional activator of pobA
MSTEIQKYNFKEGLPQEFEVLDFKFLVNEFNAEIRQPHRADFYQIIWFQEGETTHLVDFNPIQTKPNTLLFVGKDSVQRFDNIEGLNGKVILFTDNFFCKTTTDTNFLKSTILFNDLLSISQVNISKSITIFSNILNQIEVELESLKDKYQSDIVHNNLRNFLLHSERERRQQGFIEIKSDVNLEYALVLKDLLDTNYIQHKKVSFYCEQMNLTSKRLNQATAKIFGKTAKEIIDDRVLLASKRLLVHTNESVKEIAFSLGFEEPTNFVKYFKKHTNKTPVEFRSEFTSV